MKDMLSYKEYFGSVHYSDGDQVFYGKIEFIKGLVNYEGTDVQSLRSSFEDAVDDYLEMCKAEGMEPEKSFRGSFNVRTGSELHRKATLFAKEKGVKLNKVITDALDQYLSGA